MLKLLNIEQREEKLNPASSNKGLIINKKKESK